MRYLIKLLLLVILNCVPVYPVPVLQSREEKLANKYYEKWLNEDVVYIITDEERAVFSKLQAPEEKDGFIEEFWRRRSSNPGRDTNDFKEEHYRRIAYANAKFGSGIPGWKTDRGRIYIMFGEPAEIEDHSGGENYSRKRYEGGGHTAVYPFQVWRYRRIEGIGDDIEIEFVDQSWTGLYKMVLNQWEKDMLLNVDGEGLTTSERLGLTKREYRPGLHPGNLTNMTVMSRYGMRLKDTPFERMLQYFQLQRPPAIKQKELQTIVQTRVSYNTLPFHHALNYIWIDGEKALVPITIEIENTNLSYRENLGRLKARVGLYGVVTGLNGRVAAEFEDSIVSEYTTDRFPQGKLQKSMYQKPVILSSGLYKLDLVVKDLSEGNLGTVSSNLNIPRFQGQNLSASPILLAKTIQPMDTFPDAPQSFLIGDLKVVPNVTRAYRPSDHLSLYVQVYNAGRDPSEAKPKLTTQYAILQGDKVVTQLTDKAGTSVTYATEHRVVLARRISLQNLVPGPYKLRVSIEDVITGQLTSQEAPFEVIAP